MSGKYVTFVDSDDLIHPEMLERLHKAISEDGSDVAICSFERFNDGDEAICDLEEGERTVVDSKKVLADGSLMNRSEAWGKLYRAEIFSAIRFKEGILYEDTHIHPYVLNSCERLSLIGEKMYYYRQIPTSIMNATVNERKFCVFDICSEHVFLYRALNMPVAAEYSYQLLVVKTVKASVICGKSLKRRFYKTYFENLPTVVFAPSQYLGIKNRLLYLSAALPLKIFRDYYKKRLSASVNFSDTNNF
jgi:glycosyltransferase involved in cell wall biosynthesis